eukprot:Gb_38289 [translate_table: standard]
MAQGDARNLSGPKRPRTDAPRNEGDWTCPKCGNVNFAFRSICNMRNCSASKPADYSSKTVGGPIPTPYGQALPSLYMGAPPATAVYIGSQGIPPAYGASLPFGGASGIHYDMPFSGVSGVPYDYGAHVTASGPYSTMRMPSSYGHGAVIAQGPGYGATPLVDGYGLGMPISRGALGLRPGGFPDESGSRKRRGDGLSDGDWVCPKCGNTNFSFRTICNMRNCSTPKPTEHPSKMPNGAKSSSKAPPPEGSWTCDKCGNVNYPFRTKCNRANCGAEKPSHKNESNVAIHVLHTNADDYYSYIFGVIACCLSTYRHECLLHFEVGGPELSSTLLPYGSEVR